MIAIKVKLKGKKVQKKGYLSFHLGNIQQREIIDRRGEYICKAATIPNTTIIDLL
jgi:hypothetical protein